MIKHFNNQENTHVPYMMVTKRCEIGHNQALKNQKKYIRSIWDDEKEVELPNALGRSLFNIQLLG